MKKVCKYRILAIIVFSLSYSVSLGQQKISWKDLADVDFTYDYLSNIKILFAKPDFSESVKALEGKEVAITGYVMPMDTEYEAYALSENPFINCFFCGNAGPETVLELKQNKKRKFDVDDFLTFKGVLKLNSDPYKLTYTLEDAAPYKP